MPQIYCRAMSIKSDRWIRRMVRAHRMIEPFADYQPRAGVISYGVSSYGYDMRVAPEFKIFTNALSAVVDPKQFDPKSFVEFTGDVCIVPPNSFALARSIEYFRIPRNVLTICVGKTTYARCGIITNVTPFEPEWEGFVTLEISQTTPLPARSTPTKASPRCCSSPRTKAMSAKSATRTRRGSTRRSAGSHCRGCSPRAPRSQQSDEHRHHNQNCDIGHPSQLEARNRHLQEIHHEIEQAEQQAQEHRPLQPPPELGQQAAGHENDRALPRRERQRRLDALDQGPDPGRRGWRVTEEPGVHQRDDNARHGGAYRRPGGVPDHDAHTIAIVGHRVPPSAQSALRRHESPA